MTDAPTDPWAVGTLNAVLGAPSVTHAQVVVPDHAVTERVMIANEVRGRRAITLINAGAITVYLGGRGVTPTTGFPLPAGAAISLEVAGEIWGTTAGGAGSATVGYLAEHYVPSC